MKKSPIYHNPKGPAIRATFVAQDKIITHVRLALSAAEGFEWEVEGDCPAIFQWVEEYCAGKEPTTKLNWSLGEISPFTGRVLRELSAVPFGTFYTYGEFASLLDNPNAARAVGSACGRNPLSLLIPCHRIVAANRSLGGFTGDLEIKRRLLEFESIGMPFA
jgi:methylated-DNA-[protein]-cysteine S-methyltransferase